MEKGIEDFKIQTDKELELFDKVIMIMARANGAIILSKILNRGISCLKFMHVLTEDLNLLMDWK